VFAILAWKLFRVGVGGVMEAGCLVGLFFSYFLIHLFLQGFFEKFLK